MSQNHITLKTPTGRDLPVIVGWDRQLSEYFSNCLPDDDDDGDYSALTMQSYDDVEALAENFRQAGYALPRAVIDAVALDCEENAGNRIRVFDATGKLESEFAF